MPTALLDSFQLIVGLYLFYVAIKGQGQFYRFGSISMDKHPVLHHRLRLIYAFCGLLSLLDFAVCALQNTMFQVTYTDTSTIVTRKFVWNTFPQISYAGLSIASNALVGIMLLILVGTIFYLIRKGKEKE